MTNRLLRMPEVQNRTGLSRTEIYRRMKNGIFPTSIALGMSVSRNGDIIESALVGWIEREIDAWVEERIRGARLHGVIREEVGHGVN